MMQLKTLTVKVRVPVYCMNMISTGMYSASISNYAGYQVRQD